MPYIGKQLVRGQNRKLDDISSGFNGSQTTFTLQIASQNVSVGSALQLWISVGGVIQNPLTDFTIAGNQITFTTAPAASLDFFGVIQGDVTDTNTPGDATVTTSKLSTGLTVNLADGSAATSSLQLGGTDSGLFSSAADKVNVTTGGVERLEIGSSEVVFNDGSNDVDFRVESNGNANMLFVDAGNDRVGIGTTSPANNLDIAVDSNNEGIQISSSTNVFGKIDFHANRSGADAALGILDFNWNNTQVARIIGGTGTDTTNKDDGVLQFHTAAAGSASEAMRIDSSGNVGIGTSSPSHGLLTLSQSASSAFNALVIQQGNTGSAATDGLHIGIDSAVDAYIMHKESRALAFGTANTERMRIDSSGNVGVGLTSPASKLHVKGGSLTVEHSSPSTGTGQLNINSENNSQVTFSYDDQGHISFGTATTPATQAGFSEKLRIDSSGKVLINTTAPSQYADRLLTVGDTSLSSSNIEIRTATNGFGGLVFSDSTASDVNSYRGTIEYSHSTNHMQFRVDAVERMRIDSTGKTILLGTSTNGVLVAETTQGAASNKNIIVGGHSASSIDGGTGCFVVLSNGNVVNTNNSYGSLSDVKLKENIVDASSQWDDIKAVQVRNYNLKESTGQQTHTQLGVVAQEVELVSPGLVSESPDLDADGNDLGTVTKSVNYSVLYMKAVKALQEAISKIETLETKVAALEAG